MIKVVFIRLGNIQNTSSKKLKHVLLTCFRLRVLIATFLVYLPCFELIKYVGAVGECGWVKYVGAVGECGWVKCVGAICVGVNWVGEVGW